MEFFSTVEKRISYRGQFTDKQLSKLDIEKILQAGAFAPSGKNFYTTRFVAVSNKTVISDIAGIMNAYGFSTAPFVLVVTTEDMTKETITDFATENYSSAIQNIMLAVTDLGYATVWTDGVTRNPVTNKAVRDILKIDDKYTIRAVMPIGEPAEECKRRACQHNFEDFTTFV